MPDNDDYGTRHRPRKRLKKIMTGKGGAYGLHPMKKPGFRLKNPSLPKNRFVVPGKLKRAEVKKNSWTVNNNIWPSAKPAMPKLGRYRKPNMRYRNPIRKA